MYGEHEAEDLLRDSWERLLWVERQITLVRRLAQPWMSLPREAALSVTIEDASMQPGRVEFVVDVERAPDVDPDINFLIGNIVTDARSCLDMAIDAIWRYYALPRKGVQVQFPLEDDFNDKKAHDSRLRNFLEHLDPRFVEVIEQSQPDYVGGLVDIPANLSAIFISKLSNANKHRNITPVVVHLGLASVITSQHGLHLSVIDAEARHGKPPLRFALEYDVEKHSDVDARGYVASLGSARQEPIRIHIAQRLEIDGQEIPLHPPRFHPHKIEWRAELDDLLTKVPAYVRLVLRNLNRVHSVIQRGDDQFYLLDQDATV